MKKAAHEMNILYDSKCFLCLHEINFLARMDTKGKLMFTDIEDPLFDSTIPQNGYTIFLTKSKMLPIIFYIFLNRRNRLCIRDEKNPCCATTARRNNQWCPRFPRSLQQSWHELVVLIHKYPLAWQTGRACIRFLGKIPNALDERRSFGHDYRPAERGIESEISR